MENCIAIKTWTSESVISVSNWKGEKIGKDNEMIDDVVWKFFQFFPMQTPRNRVELW